MFFQESAIILLALKFSLRARKKKEILYTPFSILLENHLGILKGVYNMRILDEQDREITLEDVDLTLGYLREETIVIANHPKITHYEIGCFYFDDGSKYAPYGEDDPHVEVVDRGRNIYRYIPQEGEESHEVKGMDIKLVVDQEAYTERETIQRYLLYTEDEVVQHTLPKRVSDVEEALEENNLTIEDLILLMAEVLGGDEEEIPEEEETPEEETPEEETPEEEIPGEEELF